MLSLSSNLKRPIAFAVGLLLVVPQLAGAAPIWGLAETGVTTRGDFIRATFHAFDIQPSVSGASPYTRVPRALQPYVSTAYNRGYLGVFGDELLPAQPITRGQALQVLVKVKALSAEGKTDYRDVRDQTDAAKAVELAMKHQWMAPLRNNYFGVSRVLTREEAIRLLKLASGHSGPQAPAQLENTPSVGQTIRINLGNKPRSLTLPKAEILDTVWEIINQDFLYDDRIDGNAAAYSAVEALVGSLNDPYSSFLRPARAANFRTQIQGEVTGIGAQVEERNGVLTIVTPLRTSPAERAGLQPGDAILQADGVNLTGLGFLEAVDKVRGPRGTSVKLRIRRNGIEFDVSVTRDIITIPEIEITWQGKVAIVRLMQFGQLTDTRLRGEMVKVQAQNPKGIILDLRNNPGGLLHAAQVVVSNFVPKGSTVALIRSRTHERTEHTEEEPTIAANVPVVVLINGGSASASEIVAGALQDAGRAHLVGTKTFGKGTVQEILQFSDQSSLKLTIAEWLTPLNRKIDGVGVEPDFRVEFSTARDEQLLKALDLLR